jgi:hypothetical protein
MCHGASASATGRFGRLPRKCSLGFRAMEVEGAREGNWVPVNGDALAIETVR